MRNIYLFFIALAFVALSSSVVEADDYRVNDYRIRLEYHHWQNLQNQDGFKIFGSASEGKSCKKLEIKVSFSNHEHYKGYFPAATIYIENYDAKAWNDFSSEVILETEKKYLSKWGFHKLNVNCVE